MAITNKIKNLENINDFSKIGLIYFDNSGENLLRHYLEGIFHIKTGCNIKSEYLDNNRLIFPSNDEVNSNWVIASDYPTRNEEEYINTEISSAILLIRNPVDIIISKALLNSKYYEDAFKKIDELIDEWKQFIKYWIKSPIPIHLIRYEDLLIEPEEILKQVCKFMLGIKSIENTKLEYIINQVINKSAKVDENLLAYNMDGETFKNFLTQEVSEKIQKMFFVNLNKMLKKLNYELNANGEMMDWMANYNRDSLVKMVEFHESLYSQYLTATFSTMKIG